MVEGPPGDGRPHRSGPRHRPGPTLLPALPVGLAAAAVAVIPAALDISGGLVAAIALVYVGGLLALVRTASGWLAAQRASTQVRTSLGLHDDIAAAVGRRLAVVATAVGLGAASALQICAYGLVGALGAPLLSYATGVDMPWWTVAGAAWLIVAVRGLLRPGRGAAIAVRILLAAELAVLVAFVAARFASLPGPPPALTTGPADGSVLVLSVLALCGLGASVLAVPSTFRPVSPPPVRPAGWTFVTDPRTLVGAGGVLLAALAWSVSGVVGAGQGIDAVFALVERDAGTTAAMLGRAIIVGSLVLAAIAAHRAVTGHLFVLGHRRLLPSAVARTARRTAAPVVASAVGSMLTAVAIAITAVAGVDPYRDLFLRTGFVGALGVLILLTVTAWTAVAVAVRQRTHRTVTVVTAIAVTVTLSAGVAGAAMTFAPTTPYGGALLAVYPVAVAVGLAWAADLRRRRPEVYRSLGDEPSTPAPQPVADLGSALSAVE